MDDTQSLLQSGISALKAGNRKQARDYLEKVLIKDIRNEKAWLWLSGAVDDDQERMECLQQVLAINPQNTSAQKGIAILREKMASKPGAPQQAGLPARQPEPPVQQPEPPAPEPEPVGQQPQPPFQQPEPVVEQSQPPVQQPEPPAPQPEPVIEQPQPPVQQPEPPAPQPEPVIQQPQPPVQQPEPPVSPLEPPVQQAAAPQTPVSTEEVAEPPKATPEIQEQKNIPWEPYAISTSDAKIPPVPPTARPETVHEQPFSETPSVAADIGTESEETPAKPAGRTAKTRRSVLTGVGLGIASIILIFSIGCIASVYFGWIQVPANLATLIPFNTQTQPDRPPQNGVFLHAGTEFTEIPMATGMPENDKIVSAPDNQPVIVIWDQRITPASLLLVTSGTEKGLSSQEFDVLQRDDYFVIQPKQALLAGTYCFVYNKDNSSVKGGSWWCIKVQAGS